MASPARSRTPSSTSSGTAHGRESGLGSGRSQVLRARRGFGLLAASAMLGLVAASLTGVPASAATDPCPAPYPVDDLVEGQALTGLTVERGTVPEPFEATFVGVLNDGIASGVDMVLIEATSPAIDRYGIWAGMSGSPVYTEDGRLVGAVAYGLAWGTSPVAGVTPATEMYRLLRAPGAVPPAPAAEAVRLPFDLQRALTASGAASPREARSGVSALPMPIGVSGLSPQRARTLFDRHDTDLDLSLAFRAGGATGAPATAADAPVPGGNAAVALAYGDTTFAATGTVTAVCGDEVIVFGHPWTWRGRTSLSLHAANAVLVQDDLMTAFKLANPSALLGTVEQDRLAGLLATTSRLPASSPVRATFTNLDTGQTTSKVTNVLDPDLMPDLAASHIYATAERALDAWAPGEARVDWSVSGTAGTQRWTLRRHDAWNSSWDIATEMTWMLFDQMYMLASATNTTVTIDDVRVTGTLTDDLVRSKVSLVEVRKPGGRWVDIRRSPVVKKGAKLRLRVTVTASDGTRDVVKRTMGKARPGTTKIVVRGGGGRYVWAEGSFSTVLSTLRDAPSGDSAYLTTKRKGRQREASASFDHVVTGKQKGFVRVR